jgi:hypothetical protein
MLEFFNLTLQFFVSAHQYSPSLKVFKKSTSQEAIFLRVAGLYVRGYQKSNSSINIFLIIIKDRESF